MTANYIDSLWNVKGGGNNKGDDYSIVDDFSTRQTRQTRTADAENMPGLHRKGGGVFNTRAAHDTMDRRIVVRAPLPLKTAHKTVSVLFGVL